MSAERRDPCDEGGLWRQSIHEPTCGQRTGCRSRGERAAEWFNWIYNGLMATARQIAANRLNAQKAGRPKGRRSAKTIAKEEAREALRQLVLQRLRPMATAQMAHAEGIGHLYRRDKHGKYTRIKNQEDIDAIMERGLTGDEYGTYWIFMKDPSVQAFTYLLNRALDKPVEAHTVELTGSLEALVARLDQGRAYYAKLKAPQS